MQILIAVHFSERIKNTTTPINGTAIDSLFSHNLSNLSDRAINNPAIILNFRMLFFLSIAVHFSERIKNTTTPHKWDGN